MAFQLPPMPNFSVQTPDVLGGQEKAATLAQMLNAGALQKQLAPLQVQEQQEKAKQASIQTQTMQAEADSQKAMMKAWSDPEFTKKLTSTDKAGASGLGFDPNAMTTELTSRGILPKDALALTDQFVKRSQSMATTAKDVAQTGEATAATTAKGYKLMADKIGSILDLSTAKAVEALATLKQDMTNNPHLFAGVPQQDLAHLFSADLEHLPAMASVIGLDSQIADFHKSKSEAASATPAGAAAKAGAEAKARLDVESSPEALQAAAKKAKLDAEARQSAAQGDPSTAGKMLADGSLTLADLKTRGTTPQFIEQATAAAQKIDPKYNPADEMIAEHVAKSGTANQFFGSANSLIAKGGTLDQLEAQGKKIPNNKLPVLNTFEDWQKLADGKGPLAGYAATALGVADDYGKVMGGGTASDHARDAALKLFAAANSPEQRADAIKATRDAVGSQRDSRIGNNQFMKRLYGDQSSKGNTPPEVPSNVAAVLKSAGAGRHTLSDGSVWDKKADGTVVKAQ